ncbi:uncharacterized protein EDB91DRAFT_1082400 [Suillus paluster]|uniref:uncharacterized protein n=1 Tax=Suillus paluster TaxID=48578 RepID=UPI001B88158D|nr:uncharacterized protein EDB91DRAFT_1082400 [Suillus paluster]KAG1739466.1 hypothetical protein EDB91DRAFT_1082400 [Suillus paluster]
MQTEYSADDVALAKSLRTYTAYDYVCSLDEEVLHSFIVHDTPLDDDMWFKVDLPAQIALVQVSFTPTESSTKCQTLVNLEISLGLISVTFSEAFFVLRTYVLWNNNKFVLAVMLTGFFNWRTTNGLLYAILVKHNIFYYACGMFFSAVNVLALLLLDYQYHAMFQELQFIVLAILALRLHLHLWNADRHPHASSALVSSLGLLEFELCQVCGIYIICGYTNNSTSTYQGPEELFVRHHWSEVEESAIKSAQTSHRPLANIVSNTYCRDTTLGSFEAVTPSVTVSRAARDEASVVSLQYHSQTQFTGVAPPSGPSAS